MNTRYIPLAVLALALSLGGCFDKRFQRPDTTSTKKNSSTSPKGTAKDSINTTKDSLPTHKDSIPSDSLPKGVTPNPNPNTDPNNANTNNGSPSNPNTSNPIYIIENDPLLKNFPWDKFPYAKEDMSADDLRWARAWMEAETNKPEYIEDSPEEIERLKAFGNDGEVSDIPYTISSATRDEILRRQEEALRELLLPGATVDYGKPSYGTAFQVEYTPNTGLKKNCCLKGSVYVAEAYKGKVPRVLEEEKKEGINPVMLYRLALVDKAGKLVACSQTYQNIENRDITFFNVPMVVDVPAGEYDLQYFAKLAERPNDPWEKVYFHEIWWGKEETMDNELAKRDGVKLTLYRTKDERYETSTPIYKKLTVVDDPDIPLLGDFNRILRDDNKNLSWAQKDLGTTGEIETNIFKDTPYTACVTLRNHSNKPIRGKIFIRHSNFMEKGLGEAYFGTAYNFDLNVSDFYDVEIPPHKQIKRVLQAKTTTNQPFIPIDLFVFLGMINRSLTVYFVPEGKSAEEAVYLLPDKTNYLNLITQAPNLTPRQIRDFAYSPATNFVLRRNGQSNPTGLYSKHNRPWGYY